MRRRIAALTVTALLTGAAGISAQISAPQTLEHHFRLEWQVTRGRKGPAIDGYVYNNGMQTADRMILQIEGLDASGKVVGNSTVWVLGAVPKGGRAYFCPKRRATACRCSRSTGSAVVAEVAAGCSGGTLNQTDRRKVRGRSDLARTGPGATGQQLAVHAERPVELAGDRQHPRSREGYVHLYLAFGRDVLVDAERRNADVV